MNNSIVEYHSHHYLIGKRLSKESSGKIKDEQHKIQNNNDFLTPSSKVLNTYSPFLYLGYLSESVEAKLKNLMSPPLFSLGERLSSHRLYLEGYTYTGQSTTFKYLALTYEDPQNMIENIIIPYLKSYFDNYTEMNLLYENIPMIPLFRLNHSMQKQFLSNNTHEVKTLHDKKYPYFDQLPFPSIKYDKEEKKRYVDFDSLELLRATPVKIKKGKKSYNEQLYIDSILSIPFAGDY